MRRQAIIPLIGLVLLGLCVSACSTEAPPSLPDSSEIGLVPTIYPDEKRGKTLYVENCEACHGPMGHGDGWRVKDIDGPPPRDFHDEKTLDGQSPASTYLAIEQGVPRTSMPSFGLLSKADRWHLAFYVVAMPHDQESAERGRAIFISGDIPKPSTPSLAQMDNQEILQSLDLDIEDTARNGLAYLRKIATYENPKEPLSSFRKRVAEAISVYRLGNHEKAEELLASSYLDELDRQLILIRSKSSGLSLAMELELHALRRSVSQGRPLRDIEAHFQRLTTSINLASPVLIDGVSAAETSAATFSCGIDGALAVFLLLILATRRGADRRERKAVHSGLILGAILLLTAVLGWSTFGDLIPGGPRMAISFLVSASVALLVLPFLYGMIRHFHVPPQTRSIAAPSWLLLLFLLSMGLIVRDTLEIVPTIALLSNHNSSPLPGFIVAVAVLSGVVAALQYVQRRVPIVISTAVLGISTVVVAIMSVGSAIRAAQYSSLISWTQAGSAQASWLSIWPTGQGILAQFLMAGACTAILVICTLPKLRGVSSIPLELQSDSGTSRTE